MINNKRPIFVILVLTAFLVAFASVANADSKSRRSNESSSRRSFLVNLGFGDVSSIIRGRLERKEYTHELNRRQMQANIVSYEVLNASRELAILILENSNLIDSSTGKVEDFALFAAKMLALKPLAPATDYPSSILNIEDTAAREIALVEWLSQERTRQMNIHKLRILSDITTLLFGTDIDSHLTTIRRIDGMLTTIIDRMYLDDAIGNGRYFGRALAALLLREEKRHPDRNLEFKDAISTELVGRYNLNLENFIGDTMVIKTNKGEERQKIENGTMMLSRNLSAGSLQISWAAIPKNLFDRWRARFKGLIGTPLAAPLYVTPEDTENGISLWMRIRDRLAQGGVLRMGYSHIVFFAVKEDVETGVKIPWVIDNYPNRVFDQSDEYVRTGGARMTFAEQVIDLSHHAGAYFTNPIAEKTQEWSKQFVAETGYQKEFFTSTELELDNLTPVKSSNEVSWQTSISENDFNQLHAEKDAKILSKNIWQKYVDGLEQAVYDGYTFHWPDPYDFYLVSSTYCSQLGDMIMRKYVGIPLEKNKSTWHWALRFFANVGTVGEELKSVPGLEKVGESLLNLPNVRKSMKLTKTVIIAPTSLALQPFMKGTAYRFESKSPEQRAQSTYLANDYRESDVKTTEMLTNKVRLNSYTDKSVDVMLDYGAAIRDLEYGTVMRASQGVVTHGFSVESIAEIATHKASPKMMNGWQKADCKNLLSPELKTGAKK